MGKIYVIGLGPGNIEDLTLGAINRIHSGTKNFLRTEKHPTVKYFLQNNIEYKSYDYLYDSEESFEEVYKKIAEELIKESNQEGVINYFVPGNPMVAEKVVNILLQKDLNIEIISGMSFIEPMIEIVEEDPIVGLKILDGSEIQYQDIDININTIITQVYNTRIASEIKIILSEIYGDEHEVYLIHNAGIKEKEIKEVIPVYKLDRSENIGHLTSIYLPKIQEKDKEIFDFKDLLGIMKMLRSQNGCPWDIEQTHESIRQSVIEEAYEVVESIEEKNVQKIVEELGDLLFQVIFHSQIGYDEGEFNIYDITSALGNKLIYRHPHVFSQKSVENSEEVVYNWNMLKYAKRNIHSFTDKLKDIPRLPSLMTSFKLQEKAAEIGFDWEDINGPINKVIEEYKEVLEAVELFGGDNEKIEEEIGDLLFAVVNFARFLNINPELALNRTIRKFINRFEFMEKKANENSKKLEDMTLVEMDYLWNEAKIHKIH